MIYPLGGIEPPADRAYIELEDGFGSYWVKCDDERCDLEIVRPGKVQCSGYGCVED